MAVIKDSTDVDNIQFLLDYCSKRPELYNEIVQHLYERFHMRSAEISLLVTYYVAEERRSNGNNKPEHPIPHTETHIVTYEDFQLAYNRGYMEGMKRGMIGG